MEGDRSVRSAIRASSDRTLPCQLRPTTYTPSVPVPEAKERKSFGESNLLSLQQLSRKLCSDPPTQTPNVPRCSTQTFHAILISTADIPAGSKCFTSPSCFPCRQPSFLRSRLVGVSGIITRPSFYRFSSSLASPGTNHILILEVKRINLPFVRGAPKGIALRSWHWPSD